MIRDLVLSRWFVGAALGLFFVVCITVSCVFLPTETYWSGDSGLKFLQTLSIHRHGSSGLLMEYPGRVFDPKEEFYPLMAPFTVRIGDRFLVRYPLAFPIICVPFYSALGHRGLYLLVALASVAALFLSERMLAPIQPRTARWALILLAFATPVFVYSVMYWEHTIGLAFAMGSLAVWTRSKTSPGPHACLISGVLIGMGAWFRAELLPFGASVFIVALAANLKAGKSRTPRDGYALLLFLAGIAFGYLPSLLIQKSVIGVWLPGRVGRATELLASAVKDPRKGYFGSAWRMRPSIVEWFFFRFSRSMRNNFLFGTVIVLFWIIWHKSWRIPHWVRIVVAMAVTGSCLAVVAYGYLYYSEAMAGLFAAVPFLCLVGLKSGKVRDRRERLYRWMMRVCCVYLFLVVVVNPANLGGRQWGPRYLMPILPVAVFKAVEVVRNRNSGLRLMFACLLVLALMMNCLAVKTVRDDKIRYREMLEFQNSEDVEALVFEGKPLRWGPQQIARVYLDKLMFLPRDQAHSAKLVAGMRNEVQCFSYSRMRTDMPLGFEGYELADHAEFGPIEVFIFQYPLPHFTEKV